MDFYSENHSQCISIVKKIFAVNFYYKSHFQSISIAKIICNTFLYQKSFVMNFYGKKYFQYISIVKKIICSEFAFETLSSIGKSRKKC